jgi:hypothetical protein
MGMFVTSAFLVSDTCFLVSAGLRGGADGIRASRADW